MILVKTFKKSAYSNCTIDEDINKWIKEENVCVKDIKYIFHVDAYQTEALVMYEENNNLRDPKQVLEEARLKKEFAKEIIKRDNLLKAYINAASEIILRLDIENDHRKKLIALNEQYLELIASEGRTV